MVESDAARATRLYVEALASSSGAQDWHDAVDTATKMVRYTLDSSRYLNNVPQALTVSGRHAAVLRAMAAPPISQDQFALLCTAYSKSRENRGTPFPAIAADEVAAKLVSLLDRRLACWLDVGRSPSESEVRKVVHVVAPMLAQQLVATLRRNRLSTSQEGMVIALMEARGWQRMNASLVEQSSTLPLRHYMNKTRFATKTRPQEVDIACGLGKSVVLAMECKVTNDRTNSVKRVNDILKKATAWQDHWGSFVRTAALLQGVVAERDVARLTAADVQVFWSHDLDAFSTWLDANLAA